MPRKAKVQAVPVDPVVEDSQPEGLMVAREVVEEKTDAEQLTDVINEVKAEAEATVAPTPEVEVEAEAPVEAKPKAKRAPKAKAKAVAPVEDTPPPVVEAPPAIPVAEAKVEEAKVACPDCGKQMSAKTLKYSHKCSTAKAIPAETTSRIVEIVEDEVEKRLSHRRAERIARREAMVEKLMQSAF
jgi:hypothetical protein